MSILLDKKHFVCSDLTKNSNKFWIAELYNDKVITRFGRVGVTGEVSEKAFNSEGEARKYFDSRVKDKLKVKNRRDCYTEIQILEGSTTTSGSKVKDISAVALEEIQTNDPEFIRWLCKINQHDITSNTNITYSINEGVFKTPLGVVDKSCINSAKDYLDKISTYVEHKDFTNKELLRLTNLYLRYIPQDLGGSHVKIHLKDIFPNMDAIQKQADLIQSLEASIVKGIKKEIKTGERIFNTTINKIDEIDILEEMVNDRYGQKRIKNTYSVSIESVKNAFSDCKSKMSNVVKRWHGTNPANILSILRQGLIIPRQYTNGRIYGHGIYMAIQYSSSLGYAPNKEGKQFLFICEAALGKYKTDGKVTLNDDSLFLGDYTIVPRVNQCNLLYLVEFS